MKREKLLAVGGTAVLIMAVVYSLVSYVGGEFGRRANAEARIRDEMGKLQARIRQGKLAQQTLQGLQERALAAGKRLDASHTRYQQWLLNQVNAAGLADAVVQAQSMQRDTRRNGNSTLIYNLSAKGDLTQLVGWWKEFYGLECMHSLHNVTLTPIEGTDRLRIDATVQVYAMGNAADREMADLPRRAPDKFQQYAEVIANRRIFAAANRAPSLEMPKTVGVRGGVAVSLQAAAKDPDPGDKLTYSLVGPIPMAGTAGWIAFHHRSSRRQRVAVSGIHRDGGRDRWSVAGPIR